MNRTTALTSTALLALAACVTAQPAPESYRGWVYDPTCTTSEQQPSKPELLRLARCGCALSAVDACLAVLADELSPLPERITAADRACDATSALGCAGAALLRDAGGQAHDRAARAERYAKACRLGDAVSCDVRDADAMGLANDVKGLYAACAAPRQNLRACDHVAGRWLAAESAFPAGFDAERQLGRACAALEMTTDTCVVTGVLEQRRGELSGAFSRFTASCQAGIPAACSRAGEATLAGRGTAKDATKGAALLRAGCEAGDGLGCRLLAKLAAPGSRRAPQLIDGWDREGATINVPADRGSAVASPVSARSGGGMYTKIKITGDRLVAKERGQFYDAVIQTLYQVTEAELEKLYAQNAIIRDGKAKVSAGANGAEITVELPSPVLWQ